MTVTLTVTQKHRLTELNAKVKDLNMTFENTDQRDAFYKEKEKIYIKVNREKILDCIHRKHKPLLVEVQNKLSEWLCGEGFTQVVTPLMITGNMLSKMTITKEHPLTNQVFWLDQKRCLRPMLAPNLYEMMRDIQKVAKEPVRIFEVGSCFRKESQGAQHLNEFTMLNFVELAGVKEGEQMERLKSLAIGAMKTLGLEEYELVIEKSEVYGETLDVVVGDVELASGAYGPHFLDSKWGIFDTWVGIGFGIERIAMVMGGYQNIKRVGRGLAYLDGARLNV
ncbi:pyrrolysine--tRNA(Pyl) ligase large subunit [Sinanaerobacter sp. ZZT-01]|uniref:pyrrolysine--tRNA(Pyl) ligase large subunit n=1 Tax=Sinanaerobacter sp. ZZT-01 TaxID=3111540 RepID=UPI002D78E685|nr:pyrrolysine--tRNA(Pyl) ligase large subunit [Sinanaerobacter sp. ZZT-01]WRR92585.1 pyrrolysine--tRNA(Pyl) ligase large subunit [Sinanaerobacter sp. ZZT-01]